MAGRFASVAFGSSGIRGPYGSAVTPDLALALGASCATFARGIRLARDVRLSGPILEAAFVAGALAGGAHVTTSGVVPTPSLAYATRDADLGVVITASHNPAPDNGFKFWDARGAAIGSAARARILERLGAGGRALPWDRVGQASTDTDVTARHRDALLDAHDGEITGRMVLDCGSGAGCALSPDLLTRAGATLVTINGTPDGTFPGRPSEPSGENLAGLCDAVRTARATCGLAHDGDADRLVAVDERGAVVPGDALLALLARELGARRIAVPIDTSRLVWDALPDARIEVTPVGDAHVSERVAHMGGDFGGEPCGAFIFPRISLCPDGPHAALVVAAMATRAGGLGKLVEELPRYETRRASVVIEGADRARVLERVGASWEKRGEVARLDGLRVDLADAWVLARASGTEPKLRITAEARDAKRAETLAAEMLADVKRAVKEVGGRAS